MKYLGPIDEEQDKGIRYLGPIDPSPTYASPLPITQNDYLGQAFFDVTGQMPAKGLGKSPTEGLFEQYVPTFTGASLIPFKEQIEGTKEWMTPDTVMEIASLYAAGKAIPVIGRPIGNKIRTLMKLPIKPEYVPEMNRILNPRDWEGIREWVDSIAAKEVPKAGPGVREGPTPTTPTKPLEVPGGVAKPEVKVTPEIPKVEPTQSTWPEYLELEKKYSDALTKDPVDIQEIKSLRMTMASIMPEEIKPSEEMFRVSAFKEGGKPQPELSPTVKDQFGLPGIKQGLEMKGIKEGVAPTLEGTPLMESATKAKVEKLQPKLGFEKKAAEKHEGLMSWIKAKGGINSEDPSADVSGWKMKESGYIGLISKKGRFLDELVQEGTWEGRWPETTTADDLSQMITDRVMAPKAKGVNLETMGERELEKWVGKQEKAYWDSEMQMVVIPGLKEFVEKDIIPKALQLGKGLKDTWETLKHIAVPRAGVRKDVLDRIMTMKGERDKAEFLLERTSKKTEQFFNKMTELENIDFMDRLKTGQPQANLQLQQMDDFLRTLDDALGKEILARKPSMNWIENHFRILWKTIPGTTSQGFRGIFRKPLEGTKGFFKHHTLSEVSEGIIKGGIPYTYNPMTMFKLHYADAMKYLTAQDMWDGLGNIGARQFVKFGQKVPQDFVRLSDPLARVYFHVPQGMVNAGEWWVDEGAGRLLNNFLSRDYVREVTVGRGLMWVKNSTTAAELSFNAFHAVFETVETVSSGLGLGARKIWNVGVLQKNWEAIGQGFKDIITAPFTPYGTAKTGGAAIQFLTDKQQFLATARGAEFIKKFPNADQLISDLFTGGGKLAMHQDYKINSIRTFQNSLVENNYIGAAVRSIPALNDVMMKPLFEIYIPRLKIGMFLKEYPLALAERDADIATGRITRPEIARATWDFVENRLGEMNFDNLFWNRTMKSSLQLAIRSVTWKLGNIRAFGQAITHQAEEFALAYGEKRLPRIAPEMAWVWGLATTTAAMASTIMYAATGEMPREMIDYIYPKIDKEGNRISLPTYMRDLFSLAHSPLQYIGHSLSGWLSRFWEVLHNKDFYGVEIHDAEENYIQKRVDDVIHMVPLPFGVTSYLRAREEKQPIEKQITGFLGFTKAPYYITQTPAEQRAAELMIGRLPQAPRSKEEFARAKIDKGYAVELQNRIKEKGHVDDIVSRIADDVKTGKLHLDDVKRIQRRLKEPLENRVKALPLSDALQVWDLGNEDEKKRMKGIIAKKILNLENSPDELKLMEKQVYKFLSEIKGEKP